MSPQGGSLPLFILVPLASQEAPSGSLSLHSFDTIFVAQGYGVTYGFMPLALFWPALLLGVTSGFMPLACIVTNVTSGFMPLASLACILLVAQGYGVIL